MLNQLADDVEELLAELGDPHSPEVRELRERVEDTLAAARRAVARRDPRATARLGQFAGSVDAYITHYPRLAFATGALFGGVIGYIAGVVGRKD